MGQNGSTPRKPPDTPASRTWLVSHVASAGLESHLFESQSCLLYTGDCLIKVRPGDVSCRKFSFSQIPFTKLLWKEDLAVASHASLYKIIDISSWAFLWFHRFVHTSLDSFINLSVDWPINNFLIGYLTFGKYDVAL